MPQHKLDYKKEEYEFSKEHWELSIIRIPLDHNDTGNPYTTWTNETKDIGLFNQKP